MGDMGIDKWCMRMKEHKRKGHPIILYSEIDVKTVVEQDLLLKDKRVAFWEKHHSIPTTNDLLWGRGEVEIFDFMSILSCHPIFWVIYI